MTALHFDTLHYTNQLTEAGLPREIAQVHAETLRQAFGFYIDELVTKDYLDKRLSESDIRFEQRLSAVDSRLSKLEVGVRLLTAVMVAGVIIPNLILTTKLFLSN